MDILIFPRFQVSMSMTKRARSDSIDSSQSNSDVARDYGMDISSALVGKGKGKQDLDDDDDLRDLLRDTIAKRNVKGGTQVLKNTKGSSKLSKGEVGGGSFQSMGTVIVCIGIYSRSLRPRLQVFTRHYSGH